VAFLLILAWKIPSTAGKGNLQSLNPIKWSIIGFAAALTLFLFFGAGPNIITEPITLIAFGAALVSLIFLFLSRYNWNKKTLYSKFSLVSGALGFLICLTPFQEFDKSRPDNPQGMLVVGIIALILLILFRIKLRQNPIGQVDKFRVEK
jgi:peptidoglycan/LPS O-acetylase OafA/YrhL